MTIRVGVDLDDCMWGLVPAWLSKHNELTGDYVQPEDIKAWDIAQYIHRGDRDSLFAILHQKDFWKTVDPIDGAVDYMWRLCTEYDDIEVYIVTSTYYANVEPKMRRLLELFPFIDESQVIITRKKELVNLDILIDDCPENLCGVDCGQVKLLFDRPHNRWCDVEGIGAIRVHNWDEIYKYITTMARLEGEED